MVLLVKPINKLVNMVDTNIEVVLHFVPTTNIVHRNSCLPDSKLPEKGRLSLTLFSLYAFDLVGTCWRPGVSC